MGPSSAMTATSLAASSQETQSAVIPQPPAGTITPPMATATVIVDLTEDGDDDDDEQAQATVMSGNTKAPKTIYKCRYCYRHCRGIPALRTHMHKVHNLWSKYSLPVIVDCEN